MSEDLPTLGIPTIITRAERGFAPNLENLSVFGFARDFARAISCLMPEPLTESTATAGKSLSRKILREESTLAARSALFRTIKRGLEPISSLRSGF